MEELVRFIVNELVDNKEAFEVKSQVEDGITVINIYAEKDEIGKIIGRQNCQGYPHDSKGRQRQRQPQSIRRNY